MQNEPLSPDSSDPDQLLEHLDTDGRGLDSTEAARRLEEVGSNTIGEERRSALGELATYFWGPIRCR